MVKTNKTEIQEIVKNGCFCHYLAIFRVEKWQEITLLKTHATKRIQFDVSNYDMEINEKITVSTITFYRRK